MRQYLPGIIVIAIIFVIGIGVWTWVDSHAADSRPQMGSLEATSTVAPVTTTPDAASHNAELVRAAVKAAEEQSANATATPTISANVTTQVTTVAVTLATTVPAGTSAP